MKQIKSVAKCSAAVKCVIVSEVDLSDSKTQNTPWDNSLEKTLELVYT